MDNALLKHHEVVTFTRSRWREILWSLLDQRGDSTIALRAMIWTYLELTHYAYGTDDLSIALPETWADTVRWWADERTPKEDRP